MKNYYRIMLGRKSIYAEEAHNGNFIGAGWFGDKERQKVVVKKVKGGFLIKDWKK